MVDAKTHELGHVGVAITFGLVIMFVIYAVGHICGAHFNAAVTFAFALTRHFPWPRAFAYWGAQLVGALAAALLLRASLGNIAARRRDAPVRFSGTVVSLGVGDERFLDVRDPRRRDRHARGRGGGGDRDRRHDRPRRDVRRPDLGRIDEPDPLARARHSSPANLHALWLYLTAPVIGASLGGLAYQFVRGEHARSAEGRREIAPATDEAA